MVRYLSVRTIPLVVAVYSMSAIAESPPRSALPVLTVAAAEGAVTSSSQDAVESASDEEGRGMWNRVTSLFQWGKKDEEPGAEPPLRAERERQEEADRDRNFFSMPSWPMGERRELTAEELLSKTLGRDAERFYGRGDTSVLLSDYELTLDEFLKLVAVSNDRIQYQKMEWAIAKAGTTGSKSMYDPELTATYRYTDSLTPNTTEEEFRRQFAPIFDEQNHDYTIGVEQMVFTGGKVRVSVTYRQLDNNIQPAPIRGEEEKAYTGISLTQPILKGAGRRSVVEAPIRVATKDEQIAMQTFRQAQFETVANAAIVYWDVHVATRRAEARRRSVEIAETVLKDERERLRFGRSSETDVAAAEAGVAQRRVQLYAAEQDLVQARNDMRTFVPSVPDDATIEINADAQPVTNVQPPAMTDALEKAYQYRPEYLASTLRAEKEEVRIAFARNNKLPQLDLVASYGLNGLSDSLANSFDDVWSRDFETAYIGLEYRMAIGGDRRARSELSAAQLRKHQALLEIRAAEVALRNSIDTAISNLQTAIKQVREMENIVQTQQRLLDVELSRFEGGQSDSREVLEQEERLNSARETLIESQANLQKAVVGVALAEGTLLRNYNLEF